MFNTPNVAPNGMPTSRPVTRPATSPCTNRRMKEEKERRSHLIFDPQASRHQLLYRARPRPRLTISLNPRRKNDRTSSCSVEYSSPLALFRKMSSPKSRKGFCYFCKRARRWWVSFFCFSLLHGRKLGETQSYRSLATTRRKGAASIGSWHPQTRRLGMMQQPRCTKKEAVVLKTYLLCPLLPHAALT